MFWTSNNRGSALFYIAIFTAILGMLTYHMQAYMGEQATRAENKSHEHIKKTLGQEMDVILSSDVLCSSQVVLAGLDGFEIQPMLRVGATYLDKYRIKSMQRENVEDIGFGVKRADFVVALGLSSGEASSANLTVSRRVAFSVGEKFSCQSLPDKKKECEKLGAKIIDGRCTICETLGGVWREGECRI